ncbi:phytanoyl-CoA dioxygenase family protein [Acinetobacter baumannii]|uniref:phytanoyl-CoA dioxygenase family protein n=1 Tax=Acinetobacter baumannii TaxID=470 RepID=UPI002341EF48|nr:phytanoyl-CoA dioxygenase family protein [Acinetobacter baumannii]
MINFSKISKDHSNILILDGVTIVKNVFSTEEVSEIIKETNIIKEEYQKRFSNLKKDRKIEIDGNFLLESKKILDLVKNPIILSIACRFLGWNISVNYMGIVFNPKQLPTKKPMDWHQDGGRINLDINSTRPALSLKAAIWLTDGSELNKGNFHYLPKSQNELFKPCLSNYEDTPALVAAGDVILFDRRVWHTRKLNLSDTTRKVVFIDYAQRWLEPKHKIDLNKHHIKNMSDVELQLWNQLPSYWSTFAPKKSETPLYQWALENHLF